jgi:hypothetical protein
MSEALSGRQQALDELLSRISDRSKDLESVTRSFTTLLEGSLENADAKARQLGSVLAAAAESTTNAIGEQFERIRATTGEESVRTAAALRTSYEQAAAEMADALSNATTKFRDTMGDLRGMTGQIQRELEATRAELRRGVVELPQETQEASANMRRVVADQIKALNELSALVSRSNRLVDAAPAAQPRKAAVNETPVAATMAAVAAAVEQRIAQAPAPAPAPAPTVARQAEPKPAAAPVPAPAPVRQAPPAAERPAPRREEAPPRDAGARGGWLSDLLNRASRDEIEEPARTPARADRTRTNSLESLDSISVDIARMIDHEAAVELWDRYRRGESNVFTRRLYTLQGQQTFDEIRRKYRRDEEFRQTVDRYVEEFERLLAEVSRDDRDSMLTKTYLTSETGKVYTMLAHASGRFD